MTIKERCQYPKFNTITEDCKKKIKEKFEEYGNSWKGETDFNFWENRLKREVQEFIESIKYGNTSFEHQRIEGIDIINVVSMIIENIREINVKYYGRDPKSAVHPDWRYG